MRWRLAVFFLRIAVKLDAKMVAQVSLHTVAFMQERARKPRNP